MALPVVGRYCKNENFWNLINQIARLPPFSANTYFRSSGRRKGPRIRTSSFCMQRVVNLGLLASLTIFVYSSPSFLDTEWLLHRFINISQTLRSLKWSALRSTAWQYVQSAFDCHTNLHLLSNLKKRKAPVDRNYDLCLTSCLCIATRIPLPILLVIPQWGQPRLATQL